MRRALAVWLVLVGAYAATLGIDATPGERLSPREARVLLVTESIVSDGDVDLRDEYAEGSWSAFGGPALRPAGGLVEGRLVEPVAVGFPLLLAPAYALGGVTAVKLWLAALVALGFVVAAMLGRHLVPDPWATAAALVAGLSAPVLAAATVVSPEAVCGTGVATAALGALAVRDRPRRRSALAGASAIAVLPWLAVSLVPVAAACAAALARWLRRRQRAWSAFVALEVIFFSAVLYVTLHDRLFGGFTPYSASLGPEGATGVDASATLLERAPRIVGLWLDRDDGVLRWAPFAALAFVALWLVWRSRRDRLAAAVADQVHVEVAAAFLAGLCAVQLAVAVFLAPALHGPWGPARPLLPVIGVGAALAAWGLRHLPRTGAALAVLTLVSSAWLALGPRIGSGTLAPPSGEVPWAGAQDLLPRFGGAIGTGEAAVLTLVIVALAALFERERRMRRIGGTLAARLRGAGD